jgi:hypothetical protein
LARLDDFAYPLLPERGMLSQEDVFLNKRREVEVSVTMSSVKSRDIELKKVTVDKTVSEVSSSKKMSVASKKKP